MRASSILFVSFCLVGLRVGCCADDGALQAQPSPHPPLRTPRHRSAVESAVPPIERFPAIQASYLDEPGPMTEGASEAWLDPIQVGYDGGFVIASREAEDLNADSYRFLMKINGWGQLRHTATDLRTPATDLNQLQLKRGRLLFSGHAFTSDFGYLLQLDGRSSSGDDMRLLDYYLDYDVGHDQLGWEPGTLLFRTGKYKVPFTLSRSLSSREFEFTDRSVASIFFDVNRSFAWGAGGVYRPLPVPLHWEAAVFNGLVTGGAETGSSGSLDRNFAYSFRAHGFPMGDWGSAQLADFECHKHPALRVGAGFAATTIDRSGSTEFSRLRVVDSGRTLSSVLPGSVDEYTTKLFALDTSLKYHGWSTTIEYYFRSIDEIRGAPIPNLFDHGFWLQVGKFVVPGRAQIIGRWSRVQGNSGTLGVDNQSTEEISTAFAWYFRENHAKWVLDATYLDGSPVSSEALDILPGNTGWLFRSQIQFAF